MPPQHQGFIMLKKYNKATRVDQGNKRAECVRNYLNHRYNTKLENYEGTGRDRNDGEDFGDGVITMQCKVRDSGDDTIYESDQYHPAREGGVFHYKHKPGRDARTKAKFYICKPARENCLTMPPTNGVKFVIQKTIEEWGVATTQSTTYNGVPCTMIDLTTAQVKELWSRACCTYNKSTVAFASEMYRTEDKTVVIQFKIEEGDKPYGKLLFYVPVVFTPGKTVHLHEGESIYDDTTWK